MKKTSKYARKRAHKSEWQLNRHKFVNPTVEAVIRANIEYDVASLKTGAALHAYTGANAAALCNLAGRLIYIVCHAAKRHGLDGTPEARILMGTANALGDLNENPESMEKQRASIISGLSAIDRLMPSLHTYSLAEGALELDMLLEQGAGFGTQDIAALCGVANEKESA